MSKAVLTMFLILFLCTPVVVSSISNSRNSTHIQTIPPSTGSNRVISPFNNTNNPRITSHAISGDGSKKNLLFEQKQTFSRQNISSKQTLLEPNLSSKISSPLTVQSLEKSNLTLSTTSLTLQWNESATITAEYRDVNNGSFIPSATINITCKNSSVFPLVFVNGFQSGSWSLDFTSGLAFFTNPGYYNFTITASAPNYNNATMFVILHRLVASGKAPIFMLVSPAPSELNNTFSFGIFPFRINITDEVALRPMNIAINNSVLYDYIDFRLYPQPTNIISAIVSIRSFYQLESGMLYIPNIVLPYANSNTTSYSLKISIFGENVDGLSYNFTHIFRFSSNKPVTNFLINSQLDNGYYDPPINFTFSVTDDLYPLTSVNVSVSFIPPLESINSNPLVFTTYPLNVTGISTYSYSQSLSIKLPSAIVNNPVIDMVSVEIDIIGINTLGNVNDVNSLAIFVRNLQPNINTLSSNINSSGNITTSHFPPVLINFTTILIVLTFIILTMSVILGSFIYQRFRRGSFKNLSDSNEHSEQNVQLAQHSNTDLLCTNKQSSDKETLAATTLVEEILKEEYQAPDYATAVKIQQGGFPDYATFKQAADQGIITYEEWIKNQKEEK